jgi:hypothetical protein
LAKGEKLEDVKRIFFWLLPGLLERSKSLFSFFWVQGRALFTKGVPLGEESNFFRKINN